MKKILLILLVLALLIGAVGLMGSLSLGFSSGRCLVVDEDTVMLIIDDSPVVMHPRGSGWMLDGLSTGDEILVLHDGIRESYPGSTGVYALVRLGGGSMDDIPQTVIDQLTQLGWLS